MVTLRDCLLLDYAEYVIWADRHGYIGWQLKDGFDGGLTPSWWYPARWLTLGKK